MFFISKSDQLLKKPMNDNLSQILCLNLVLYMAIISASPTGTFTKVWTNYIKKPAIAGFLFRI